ncbi:MAG: hypothetical protein QXH30_03775 [Candidatus Bilamarchaeaceae archaeon]
MIKIAFSKHSYRPGEQVEADVLVLLEKPVKARGLYGIIQCIETKHVVTKKHLDYYDYERMKEIGVVPSTNIEISHREEHNKLFYKELLICGEKEYRRERFPVRFFLPKEAAPTSHDFGHDNKIHVWKLKVKLDIPFAPDENGEAEIFVDGLGRSI